MFETKLDRLKKISNIGLVSIGFFTSIIFFYIELFITQKIGLFNNPLYHLVIIPVIYAYLIFKLETKYISQCKKEDGLFAIGLLFGILPCFFNSFYIENNAILQLPSNDYNSYCIIKYFLPHLFTVVYNLIVYMCSRISWFSEVTLMENQKDIDKTIIEIQKEYDEKVNNGEIKEENKETIFKKVTKLIGQNIDSTYDLADERIKKKFNYAFYTNVKKESFSFDRDLDGMLRINKTPELIWEIYMYKKGEKENYSTYENLIDCLIEVVNRTVDDESTKTKIKDEFLKLIENEKPA